MSDFDSLCDSLRRRPVRWLVTGAAGFIGSNLVEKLLRLGQTVVGLDNFVTGHRHNLEEVQAQVDEAEWGRFRFLEGDLAVIADCREAVSGIDRVLHQGALGSVPRSIDDPLGSHTANVTGTVNLLQAARESGIKRFVYASSSSVYGDEPGLPKIEDRIGRCLSPYATTKRVDELYAEVFCRCYGMQAIGLRYFNVFGPRQDPDGPYAAVIPRWIDAMLEGRTVYINGDGETSRDFCHVNNVVQANLLAASAPMNDGDQVVFNVAVGEQTSLNQLFAMIQDALKGHRALAAVMEKPEYREFRAGDVRHSLADISAASRRLGYRPAYDVRRGLEETIAWYVADYRRRNKADGR